MAEEKLRAEWFWCDRWIASSAFLLPMEARGLYREMLTQAWLRGGRLPVDPEAIQRATGCTAKEWARAWPKIARYWRTDGDSIVNETQLEVLAEARRLAEVGSRRGRAGAEARWAAEKARPHAQASARAHAQASAQAVPEDVPEECPPSPSPERLNPPFPPAGAGGPTNGNGPEQADDGPTNLEIDLGIKALVAYWRNLASIDPRLEGGRTVGRSPMTFPTEAHIRHWRKALRTRRFTIAEIQEGIAVTVRKQLERLGVPVWDITAWPPEEAAERRPD